MTISRGPFTLRGALCLLAASALVLALVAAIGPGARAASNQEHTSVVYPNIWYAYVDAGEELTWRFEKTKDGPSTHTVPITVEGPGVAPSTDQFEQADPAGTVIGDSVVAPVAGIYRIILETTDGVVQEHFPGLFLDSGQYLWDIAANDGLGGAEIPGRVWSEEYTVRQPTLAQLPAPDGLFDITFWFQSAFGVLYEVHYTGFNGIHSVFYADPVGIVEDGTCDAAYRSIFFNDAAFEPAEGACGDGAFKLFFEAPDPLLPAEADTWDGGTEWINPPVPPPPAISNLTFTPDSPVINSGLVDFDVSNFPAGPVTLRVDTNGDGVFDGPADCQEDVAVVAGHGQTHFDGFTCDAVPEPVPPTQEIGFQVTVDRIAEIHFVNYDVEARAGVEVTQLNGPGAGDKTINWDDSHLGLDDNVGLLAPPGGRDTLDTSNPLAWAISTWPGCPAADPKCAGATFTGEDVDSISGVHGWDWGPVNVPIGWGNNRYIDDWTFVEIGEQVETLTVPGRASTFQVAKASDPPSGTDVESGDVVSYSILITNLDTPDAITLTGVVVEDDLSGVLDDATLTAGPDATLGFVSLVGDTIRWQGDLPPGETVVVSYSVTVNDEENLGDLLLENVVTTASEGATNCPPGDPGPECSTEHPVILVGATPPPGPEPPTEVGGATAAQTGALPFTGFTLALLVIAALMMLGAGVTVYEASRRRRRRVA